MELATELTSLQHADQKLKDELNRFKNISDGFEVKEKFLNDQIANYKLTIEETEATVSVFF